MMNATQAELAWQKVVAKWFRDKYPGKYVGFAPLAPGAMPSDETEVRLGDSAEEAFTALYKEPRMPLVHGKSYFLIPPNEEPDGFIGGSSLMFEDGPTVGARVQRDRGLLSAEELDRLFNPTDELGPLTDVPQPSKPLTQEDREQIWHVLSSKEGKEAQITFMVLVLSVGAEIGRVQGGSEAFEDLESLPENVRTDPAQFIAWLMKLAKGDAAAEFEIGLLLNVWDALLRA